MDEPIPILALAALLGVALIIAFRSVRSYYYFRGRIDEVEAIATASAPEDLKLDPGIYAAKVLHQVSDVLSPEVAQRYVRGSI